MLTPVAEEITLSSDQIRVLQQLLTFFNGTAILTFFVLPSAGVFSVILILDLIIQNFLL